MTSPPSRVVGVILARLDSSRLPGKALKRVGGQPLIANAIGRARQARRLDALVLATSDRPVDTPLVDYAVSCGLDVYRGSADDVVARVLGCADTSRAQYVARINGDSPFLDPALLDAAVAAVRPGVDLVTNVLERSYPYGISVEIISVASLRDCAPAMSAFEREHVTQFFYKRRDEYCIVSLPAAVPGLAHVRAVVDTPDDVEQLEAVFARLGPHAGAAGYRDVARAYFPPEEP